MNEGMWDRAIRLLIAIALGYAAWTMWPGTTAIVYLVIGAIALVTGLAGWYPAYALFGFSTKKKASRKCPGDRLNPRSTVISFPPRLIRRAFWPAGPSDHTALFSGPTETDPGVTAKTDHALLEGLHSRRKELWLVLRAVRDFIAGFRTVHFVGPCVTVFGSARYDERHPYYDLGREVGRGVADLGFTVFGRGVAGS